MFIKEILRKKSNNKDTPLNKINSNSYDKIKEIQFTKHINSYKQKIEKDEKFNVLMEQKVWMKNELISKKLRLNKHKNKDINKIKWEARIIIKI